MKDSKFKMQKNWAMSLFLEKIFFFFPAKQVNWP